MMFYFDFVELAHEVDLGRVRRRNLSSRLSNNAFDLTDRQFIKTYRLSKALARSLIEEITPHMPVNLRSDGIDTETKILVALAFYATGSYQTLVGQSQSHAVSQPSVSRAINQVTNVLNLPHIFKKYVNFPSSREDRDAIKRGFYRKFGMSGVLGCIDGTHVAIVPPSLHEERYFNRKGYHSLNTLVICDSDARILCVDPSNPGSAHDSAAWSNNPLKAILDEMISASGEDFYLLGDSGFPLRRAMMTPILNAAPNTPEAYYTEKHMSTRNVVEWCIGILKARFRCKLLVVGGGTGGCSVAWRFARRMKKNCIIILEPSRIHYYQPGFTLVAAGVKTMKQTHRPLRKILPRSVTWLQDKAEDFDPCKNLVYTCNGDKIYYEFMVVAVGIKNDYDKIIGLQQALDNPRSPVSTIYSPSYCAKTWKIIQNFTGGHALFTFPLMGGKCSGAAMKIMFLAQDYWRKNNIIKKTNITYNTGAETIFGVPKYAVALRRLALNRGIVPNYCADLVEVSHRGAVFVGAGGEVGGTISFPYNLLHVTPPMSPPFCLLKCEELTNAAGYLDVDAYSLQHKRFPNVFGLGDCTCTPNSKTASAVGPQSYVLERNLGNVMAGKRPSYKYNGYGGCPLITSYKKGILAEFVYDKKVWETFPFDQSQERRLFYQLNKHAFPYLYWNLLVKGKWNGPGTIRNIINPLKM